MAKRGRPSKYTPEIAEEICRRLAGGESLRAICEGDGLPDECTVRAWALDDVEGFSAQYARAREIQADFHGDRVISVLETKPARIVTTRADGGTEEKIDPADVARLKNLADGLKWHAGRMKPRTWGDKVQMEADVKLDIGSVLDAARKRVTGGGEP